MPLKGWYSKKDVIKDLSKATGAVYDLDEEYVVVGERPPPYIRTVDAEQELYLLRLYGGCEASPSNMDAENTPDYKGITEMLRMVEQYNEVPEKSAVSETNKHTDETIIISKLNPNVDEFVPSSNNSSSDANITVDLNIDNKNIRKIKKIENTEPCDKRSLKANSVGTSSVESSDEVREMRQKLKSKISDTSDASCVKVKKERNLAIAMLIKLHTQPNPEEKPKLITPDYFMKGLSQNEADEQKIEDTNTNFTTDYGQSVGIFKEELNDATSVDISTSTDIQKTVNDSPISILNNSKESLSKDIRESIQKVDDWLNPKTESKAVTKTSPSKPAAYFGPIKFKRKSINKTLSPVSVETGSKVQKENGVFVPSTYASELTKKYEERSKLMEKVKENIWTLTEKELKARDEIILKKRLETNTDS